MISKLLSTYVAVDSQDGVDAGDFGGVAFVQNRGIRLREYNQTLGGENMRKNRQTNNVRCPLPHSLYWGLTAASDPPQRKPDRYEEIPNAMIHRKRALDNTEYQACP